MSELSEEMRSWAHEPDICHADWLLAKGADALDAQAQEIARLTAELAQTQRDRQAEHDLRVTMQGEAETLRARLAAAQKDAERYRWLRRPTTLGVGMVMIWQRGKGRYDYATGDDLDAAVDAARGGA